MKSVAVIAIALLLMVKIVVIVPIVVIVVMAFVLQEKINLLVHLIVLYCSHQILIVAGMEPIVSPMVIARKV